MIDIAKTHAYICCVAFSAKYRVSISNYDLVTISCVLRIQVSFP